MSLSDLQDITEIVWHPLRMRLTTHFPQAAFLYLLLLFLWLAWCVGREYGRTRTLTSFLFVSYSFLLFALLFLCRRHHEILLSLPGVTGLSGKTAKESGSWTVSIIFWHFCLFPFCVDYWEEKFSDRSWYAVSYLVCLNVCRLIFRWGLFRYPILSIMRCPAE